MKKILLFLILFPFYNFAQNSGTLNPNFGNNGTISFLRQLDFVTEDAALQGSKILVSGRISANGNENIILRYNSDGTIDKTFADNGALEFDFQTGGGESKIQTFPNNSFLFEHYNNGIPLIAKYNSNGAKDLSFANNGELLLDFAPKGTGGLIMLDKPVITPDSDKITLTLNKRGQSFTIDSSYLLKLNSDGSIDTNFGTNGYSGEFPGYIASIDRNKYGNSFFDDLFGGVEGDYVLGINAYQQNHYQYVKRSGTYNDNSNNNFAGIFTCRFYERQGIQTTTNIGCFDGNNFYVSPPTNQGSTYYYQQVYKPTNAVGRPGFKVLQNENFIIFGTKWLSDSQGKNTQNFIISQLGYRDNDGDGLTDDFGTNGLLEVDIANNSGDFLIDCFEKPNKSIVGIGYSLVEGKGHALSMVQVFPNGNFDTELNSTGIFLGDSDHKFRKGFVVNIYNGFNPRWVGTSVEPYTGNVSFEFADFNNAPSYLLSNVRTKYNHLEVNSAMSYTTNSFGGNLNSILMIGSVENNSNNNFMLARNSIYSNTFGGLTNDIVQTDINNGSNDVAKAATIVNDNGVQKILVVGESDGNLAMVRYFADGNDAGLVDTSFGNNGILARASETKNSLAVSFVPNQVKSAVDGSIYICGEEIEGTAKRFALKKYTSNGNEDTSFLAFDESTLVNVAQNFKILDDGGFLVIGNEGNQLKIRKFNPDGTPNTSFGTNSYLMPDTGTTKAELHDLKVLQDGRIVVVGNLDDKGFVTIFDANGNLDSSFGTNGIVKETFGFDKLELNSVSEVDASNILISGISHSGENSNTFTAKMIITAALSVNENKFLSTAITVYPNPANNIISIKNKSNVVIENISFFDIQGRKVKNITKEFDNIPTHTLTNGVYFVKVKTDIGFANKKVIINK